MDSVPDRSRSRNIAHADSKAPDDTDNKVRKTPKETKKSRRSQKRKKETKYVPPQSNSLLTTTFHTFVKCTAPLTTECRKVDIWLIFQTIRQSLWILVVDANTWSKGIIFLIVGLAVSFISELMNQGPQYNTMVLITVIASLAFPHFPAKTVRPQVLITILVVLSFLLDIYFYAHPSRLISDHYKWATVVTALMKLLALYNMLWYSSPARRALKYIHR